jgi:hypothetical protein
VAFSVHGAIAPYHPKSSRQWVIFIAFICRSLSQGVFLLALNQPHRQGCKGFQGMEAWQASTLSEFTS